MERDGSVFGVQLRSVLLLAVEAGLIGSYPWFLLNAMAFPLHLAKPGRVPFPLPTQLLAGMFPLVVITAIFGMLRITMAGDRIDRLPPGARYSIAFHNRGLTASQRRGRRLLAIAWLEDLNPRYYVLGVAAAAVFFFVGPRGGDAPLWALLLSIVAAFAGGRVILAAHSLILHAGRLILALPVTNIESPD